MSRRSTPEVYESVVIGLLAQFVPGRGFPSQRYDEAAFSLATTGTCAYALCANNIPEADKRAILEFICESVQLDGVLPTHMYDGETIATTWAAGQCLLALTTSPNWVDAEKAKALARWLLSQQTDSGWKLRERDNDHFEPMLSFYPVLALSKACRVGWITEVEVSNSLERLKPLLTATLTSPQAHPARQLVARYLSDVVLAFQRHYELLPDLADRVRVASNAHHLTAPDAYQKLRAFTIVARDQPLWYVKMWRPALYLIARRSYPPHSPMTVLLGAELLDAFSHQSSGWSPHEPPAQHATAFTWTTALGLLATAALRKDIANAGYDEESWQQLAAVTRRAAWE